MVKCFLQICALQLLPYLPLPSLPTSTLPSLEIVFLLCEPTTRHLLPPGLPYRISSAKLNLCLSPRPALPSDFFF